MNAPRLKVFGWLADAPTASAAGQVRMIVAANSKSEVAQIAGSKSARSSSLFRLGETRNTGEIEVATRAPGTIFWKPLDKFSTEWTRLG